MQRFVSELRRRNVLRTAAFYAAAGWLLVQVTTQVFPFFNVPAWVVRVVIVTIVLAFPLVLVISWFYELTPDGLKLEADLDPKDVRTLRTGNRVDRWIIAMLAVAVAALVADKVVWRHADPSAPNGGTYASTNDQSVAVLPFENLSVEPQNAYFAAGIQDQVLTQLAKIGALKVISRTSTEQYASHPQSLGEIARQLGVANILEGSVQRVGDTARINVQLIRANGDSHLWADTYDRKLDDVFGVESEVAEAIAQALNARLTGAEKIEMAALPTHNARAWEAYLHAKVIAESGELIGDKSEAVQSLTTAVRLDPEFALAWALLSEVHAAQNIELYDTTTAGQQAALAALRQAQHLRPDAIETRLAEAYYDYRILRDYAMATRLFEQALQREPNRSDIQYALALLARRQGRWKDSLAAFDLAIALDPRNVEVLTQAAATAAGLQDFSAASRYLERAQDAAPRNAATPIFAAQVEQLQGHLDRAEVLLGATQQDTGGILQLVAIASQRLLQHRYAEGMREMQQFQNRLTASNQPDAGLYRYYTGEFQRLQGDASGASTSYRQSLAAVQATLRDQPGNSDVMNLLALVDSRLGDEAAARAAYHQALKQLPAGGDALLAATAQNTLCRIELRFGHKEAALAAIRLALSLPDIATTTAPPITKATLQLDPEWDSLRGDPRFLRIIGSAANDNSPD